MFKKISIKKLSGTSILGAIIASGLILDSSAAPVIEAPSVRVPTRTVVNPSFEFPAYSESTYHSLDNYIPGDDSTLQGWFSTHPTTGYLDADNPRYKDANGDPYNHLVEIWFNGHDGVSTSQGNQFAELNAQAESALYQDILVFANESIPWSASHRGRARNDVADIAEVFISDPSDWTGATFFGEKLYSAKIETSSNGSIAAINPVFGNVTNSDSVTALENGWAEYADTWIGPATSNTYRFAFQAVSTGGGNNAIGNFLDAVQIKLAPVVDLLDPEIDEIDPAENSIYYLPVRINGQSESQANIEIDLALNGTDFTNYTLGDLSSGVDTAVLDGVAAIKLGNGNIQLTIPAALYDPNNPKDYIQIPINFSQLISFWDKTATFEVVNVDGGDGQEVPELIIPPSDSGFVTQLETQVKPTHYPD